MRVDGGCHCGFITYEAEVDPDKVLICHCSDCQTLSGAAYRTVVFAPEADFTLLSGTPKVYVKTADSGNRREQTFCPDCGTPIYAAPSGGDGPRILGLRVGAIRQRDALPPKRQYYCRSAQAWASDLSSLPET